MTLHAHQYREEKEKEGGNTSYPLGSVSFKNILSSLGDIQQSTSRDMALRMSDMARAEDTLKQMSVDVHGTEVPLQLLHDLNFQTYGERWEEIWTHILEGKRFSNDELATLHLLPRDVAMALAAQKERHPQRNFPVTNLRYLTPDVARILCKLHHSIQLNSLRELSTEIAKIIMHEAMSIDLDGLPEISVELAKILSKLHGKHAHLHLNGIHVLPPDIAAELAAFDGHTLELKAVKRLPAESAKALAQSRVQMIWLDGLEELDTGVAEQLSHFNGRVIWLRLRAPISDDALRALASDTCSALVNEQEKFNRFSKTDQLAAQENLSTEEAKFLAKINSCPLLHVSTLTTEVASVLATRKDHLSFSNITQLTSEIASILAAGNCTLTFANMLHISDETALILFKRSRPVFLPDLEIFPNVPMEDYLAVNGNTEIQFKKLTSLTDEQVAALTMHKANLILPSLQTLSDQQAELFAQREGYFRIPHACSMTDTARAVLEKTKKLSWIRPPKQ